MNNLCLEHVSESMLERYLLGKVTDSESETIETHLLICEPCQEQLDELEEYRTAMREGFALLKAEEREAAVALTPVRKESWTRQRAAGLLNWRLPQWSLVPAAAALALAFIIAIPALRHAATPVELSLTVERGSETTFATVPAGKVFELHLDAAGLAEGAVSVEVVDAVGNRMNEQQCAARSDRVDAGIRALPAGTYFARIYASKNGKLDPERLLREFTFQVR